MAAQLPAKPGADAVPVTIGDMTTTRVPGTFKLVYLVANTIMNVTTPGGPAGGLRQRGRLTSSPAGASSSRSIVPQLRSVPPGEIGRVFTLDA